MMWFMNIFILFRLITNWQLKLPYSSLNSSLYLQVCEIAIKFTGRPMNIQLIGATESATSRIGRRGGSGGGGGGAGGGAGGRCVTTPIFNSTRYAVLHTEQIIFPVNSVNNFSMFDEGNTLYAFVLNETVGHNAG